MERRPRLNLFALPSQTTLVFLGIMIVIGLPLLMGFTGRFLLLLPLLPVVVVLFTLWDFLADPVRVQRRYAAKSPTDEDGRWLAQRVDQHAFALGLRPPPVVLESSSPALHMPAAFGTWRQRYLLLPAGISTRLRDQAEQEPAAKAHVDVVICHELAHFVNRDVVLASFARSLLRQTIFVTLAYWLALMWTPILYALLAPVVPQQLAATPPELLALLPASWLSLLQAPPQQTPTMMSVLWLELSMAVLPLAAGALVLLLRDWKLLMRVREYFADARVVQWLGEGEPSVAETHRWFRQQSQVDVQAVAALQAPAAAQQPQQKVGLRLPGLDWLRALPGSQRTRDASLWLLPGPQPVATDRRTVLEQPHLAYGSVKQIGLRTGVIVVLLYLMLASLMAPAPRGIGAEIVLGVGFLGLAAALTPSAIVHLPDRQAVRHDRLRAVGWCVLVFNGFFFVMLAIAGVGVLALPWGVDMTMYAIAGVLPATLTPVIEDPLGYVAQILVGSLLTFGVAVPLLLYWFLALDQAIKQRMLAWYGASWPARRLATALLAISGVLALILWLGVAPVVSRLSFPLILSVDWGFAAGAIVALALASGLALWLRRGDQRWRARCPHCGHVVDAPFALGIQCDQCGERLQPALVVDG